MLSERVLRNVDLTLKAKSAFKLLNRSNIVSQDGIKVTYHFFNPEIYTHHSPISNKTKGSPLLPPYPENKCIEHIHNHYLLVNKYMVKRGHIVISSDSDKDIQTDPLRNTDFDVLAYVINGYREKGIAYYNCGRNSGCSQMHKHMQFAPFMNNYLFDHMAQNKPLPYRYYTQKLSEISGQSIKEAYEKLMNEMRDWKGSYNFLVHNRVAAVVPRVQSNYDNHVNINSLGVSGHIFVWKTDSDWIKTHPLTIIKGLCVPK